MSESCHGCLGLPYSVSLEHVYVARHALVGDVSLMAEHGKRQICVVVGSWLKRTDS